MTRSRKFPGWRVLSDPSEKQILAGARVLVDRDTNVLCNGNTFFIPTNAYNERRMNSGQSYEGIYCHSGNYPIASTSIQHASRVLARELKQQQGAPPGKHDRWFYNIKI